MKSVSGSYVGNGTADREISIGFQPEMVMINGVVWRTAAHPTNSASYFANNAPNVSNAIKTFTTEGFTVGTSTLANTNGTTYYYFACQSGGGSDFSYGTYTGTGVTQSISGLPYSPNLVVIKGNISQYAWWRTSGLSGNNTLPFAAFGFQPDRITAITADGFTIGTNTEVNQNGATFYWAAFGGNPTLYQAGSYTGNATDDRAITGVGFQPTMVWIKGNNSAGAQVRFDAVTGDASAVFNSGTYSSNSIQSFEADGFTIGTNSGVNENGVSFRYFAIAPGFATVAKTFTAKAAVGNDTVRFTAKARVKNALSKSFTARAWVRKNVAGPLANVEFRGMDMMKWTKDTITGQPSDTTIENLVAKVQQTFNLTHIAFSIPIDPVSFYPSGFTPSPRTAVAFYQKWADTIHGVGLRVLHRAVSFRMEPYNSGWPGTSYPAGNKQEIIPALGTFTDNFNRANVYTAITQSSSTFQDTFATSPISTTNWNTIGNWGIANGELVCDQVANATSNLIWSKATYTDFTLTAKVKKVASGGFSAVAFRMSRNTANGARAFANYFSGYLLELRDGNVLRVENIATANLAQTIKTWTTGAYYRVKITCAGTNIKAKVWADGSSEPGTWDLDFNDGTYSSGGVGFCPENTNTRAVFDDAVVTFSPTTTTTSDWNQLGVWSVDANVLKCSSSGPQYANILYSKTKYSNFTFTSKVKSLPAGNNGKVGVIFRGNTQSFGFGFTAYTARISSNNQLQLEDMSLANLSNAAKTFEPDTFYWIKVTAIGNHIQVRAWKVGDSEPSTWDIDYTDATNRYPSGSVGFAPENTAPTYYDDVTVSIATNYNSWLGVVYKFITDNPDIFADGDIWAPFPEQTEAIFRGASFLGGANQPAVYSNWFNDMKEVADYAFSVIGKNVHTGYTADNFSEVISGYLNGLLNDSRHVVVSADYYGDRDFGNGPGTITVGANETAVTGTNTTFTTTFQVGWTLHVNHNGADLKKVIAAITDNTHLTLVAPLSTTTAFTNKAYQVHDGYIESSYYNNWNTVYSRHGKPLMHQEWGPVPDMVSASATQDQSLRETQISRPFYDAMVQLYEEGKLKGLNYWGFWDTGANDTGAAQISSTLTLAGIKIRREGWILESYLNPGPSPQRIFTARARIAASSTKTFTAKASVVAGVAVSFTAKAAVENRLPTDRTSWTVLPDTHVTTWTPQQD